MEGVLKGEFIALNYLIKELESSHTNELKSYLKALGKIKANTPWKNRWQEVIKHRNKNNQLETKRIIQKLNETKN